MNPDSSSKRASPTSGAFPCCFVGRLEIGCCAQQMCCKPCRLQRRDPMFLERAGTCPDVSCIQQLQEARRCENCSVVPGTDADRGTSARFQSEATRGSTLARFDGDSDTTLLELVDEACPWWTSLESGCRFMWDECTSVEAVLRSSACSAIVRSQRVVSIL